MAEIIQNEGGGKKKGKKRAKKHSSHIDMTPMVDLACLLLTFFMLTTAFAKPKVMEVVFPEKQAKKNPNPPKVDEKKVLNVILDDNNKIYWYNGMVDPTKPLPEVVVSDYSKDGIRKVLLKRNEELFSKLEQFNDSVLNGKLKMPNDSIQKHIRRYKKADKVGPIVMIKAMSPKVRYANIVDIIDEMAITSISRYAIVDLTPVEKPFLESFKASQPKQ